MHDRKEMRTEFGVRSGMSFTEEVRGERDV
jgi:hypothetical protein